MTLSNQALSCLENEVGLEKPMGIPRSYSPYFSLRSEVDLGQNLDISTLKNMASLRLLNSKPITTFGRGKQ